MTVYCEFMKIFHITAFCLMMVFPPSFPSSLSLVISHLFCFWETFAVLRWLPFPIQRRQLCTHLTVLSAENGSSSGDIGTTIIVIHFLNLSLAAWWDHDSPVHQIPIQAYHMLCTKDADIARMSLPSRNSHSNLIWRPIHYTAQLLHRS